MNVAHVLEGSVRNLETTVRITAQLIRASRQCAPLVGDRYDRPLDDIFAVQDEIAGAIVQALQIRRKGLNSEVVGKAACRFHGMSGRDST